MVKIKMSTASDMCLLFCSLIVCTLVSTARTNSNTTSQESTTKFDSTEYEDWAKNHGQNSTSIKDGKYGSMTTVGTPSVTDVNDPHYNVTDDALDNSTKPENGNHLPEKEYNSTEPITTTNVVESLGKPPKKTQFTSTTLIAIQKNEPTTTPSTLSDTDLNVKPSEDVIDNSLNQTKPKNDYDLSHEKYSSFELQTSEDDNIVAVTMRYKTKKFPLLDPISSFLAERLLLSKSSKETTTTKMLEQFEKFNQREQEQNSRETMTNDFNKQMEKSEESKKWEIQQKMLEMESDRLNSILDILNNP